MAIQFELYKTPRPKDEADKETYHARVVNFQHIDTDYLAITADWDMPSARCGRMPGFRGAPPSW